MAAARLRGGQAGRDAAEAFEVIRHTVTDSACALHVIDHILRRFAAFRATATETQQASGRTMLCLPDAAIYR